MKKRCVVVGSSFCGKSSLLSVLKTNEYPEDGPSNLIETFSLTEKDLTIEFNDSERYQNVSFKDFDIVLICFKVTEPYSYSLCFDVFREAKEHIPFAHYVFLGLQSDLRQTTEVEGDLEKEKVEKKFKELGYPYVECSAKNNEGFLDLLLTFIDTLQKIPGPVFTKDMVSEESFQNSFAWYLYKDNCNAVEFLCNKMKTQDVFQYFKLEKSPFLECCSAKMFFLLLSKGFTQDYNLCLYYLIENNYRLGDYQEEIALKLFELGADPSSKVIVKNGSEEDTIDLMKYSKDEEMEKIFKNEAKRRNKIKEQLEREKGNKSMNDQKRDIKEMKEKLKTLEEKMDLIISLLKK